MQFFASNFNSDFVNLVVRPVGVAFLDVREKPLPSLKKIIKCVGFFLAGHCHGWRLGGNGSGFPLPVPIM